MSTQNLALFKALGAKMGFLGRRQGLIAQNVANADTPGYRPLDLKPADFSSVLKTVTASRGAVHVRKTNAAHMAPGSDIQDPDAKKQKDTYEVAPTGNAVVMEEQLIKAGQTVMDYNLMSNLYEKNIRMIRTALGTNSGA